MLRLLPGHAINGQAVELLEHHDRVLRHGVIGAGDVAIVVLQFVQGILDVYKRQAMR